MSLPAEYDLRQGVPPASRLAFGRPGFDAAAVAVLFCAYAVTLYVTHEQRLSQAVWGAAANIVPVVVFGGAARRVIIARIVGRSGWRQFVGHLGLGLAFSALSLWLLLVLLAMLNELSVAHFTVVPLSARGNAWQFLENATTYAVIAMLSYLQAWQRQLWLASHPAVPEVSPPLPVPPPPAAPPRDASRHFIRRGEDILPVDLDRIVCITGADDYVEVSAVDGTYLVKMTLTEFTRTLDPVRFLRVHRSSIINVACIERAESAGGGRLLVHMSNGRTVRASRAGSQLLRTRIL
ncbi:LytTR family DNA-binding domain-containing protein [Solimonas marina]|uniref:LytTR family transcriptional regulator n=1 Tax=Solimonas marina TaxID=2714601 RepID=A0A969WDY3_9GAMM|nr:LytTR family DNA-binding domain-containing protein [Solimonas marina]NKF23611.1 LytTR family transcriptional regulator [Solimonas marina]